MPDFKNNYIGRTGGGLVVSVLAFYCDNSSSNPSKVVSFV